jgi:putative acetyltransferase
MPTIATIQPQQAAEARRVIYTTAHLNFHEGDSLEDTIRHYQESWPLLDLDNVQAGYFDKNGTFLVMMEEGRIIGTGALRRLAAEEAFPSDAEPEKICEIKRLWFLPEYHGKGLGYQMMQVLLSEARRRGYTLARLETSPAYQQRAYNFYHRLGFYDIPRYGNDLDDVGMEMKLE